MKVAVLAATGSVGSLVVDELLARGHEVVAVVRRTMPSRGPVSKMTVEVGDLADPRFVAGAIAGCDAVISCLGQTRKSKSLFAKRTSPADILSRVATATLRALDGSQHYIYVSAFGVGEDFARHSWLFRTILRLSPIHDAYLDHAEAEGAIRQSQAKWTIVRPPGLNDAEERRELVDTSDRWKSSDSVSRRSVAAFLARTAERQAPVYRAVTIGHGAV